MTAERIRKIICEWIDEYQKEKDNGGGLEEDDYWILTGKIEVLNDLLEKIDKEEAKHASEE